MENEVFDKKMTFFAFAFYVGERQTEKKKNTQRTIAKNAQKDSVLGGCHEKLRDLDTFLFYAEHYLCLEGRRTAFQCTLSVLAKMFWGQNSPNQETL